MNLLKTISKIKFEHLNLIQKAFTLAEMLIVVGIIGVVASLTLPNLNSSTGNKETIAKLQKIYSDLNEAYGRAIIAYGPYRNWSVDDGQDADKIVKRQFERITEFMKYSKVCTASDACSLFSNANSAGMRTKHAVKLADGATIGFGAYDVSSYIYVDLDGPNKGANTTCKDVFRFEVTIKGITPENHASNTSVQDHTSYCTAWVLENENMDYLKCSGLKFVTNTSCK